MIILIILYSFIAFGEELLQNKLILKNELWNFGYQDAKGNLVSISNMDDKKVSGKISLLDEAGKTIRFWDVEKYPYTIRFFAYGMKNGDILTVIFDPGSKGKENIISFQVSSGPKFTPAVEDTGQIIDLENDLIAMNCTTCQWLYLINVRGRLVKKVDVGRSFIAAGPTKDIIVQNENKISVYDTALNLKAEYTEPELKLVQGMIMATTNGNIIAENDKNELMFFTSGLKLISKFKGKDKFKGMENMPDTKIAAINNDGYLYFLDQFGVEKAKSFHDSTSASMVTFCGKNAVYFNKTELVFVNTDGKELGTYKMPDPQQNAYLHPMKNNFLVLSEGPPNGQTLYFLKCLTTK